MVTLENELFLSLTVLGFALVLAAVPSLPREPVEASDSDPPGPPDGADAPPAGEEEAVVVTTPRRTGNVRVLTRGDEQATDEHAAVEAPPSGDQPPGASQPAAVPGSADPEPPTPGSAKPAHPPGPAPREHRAEPPPSGASAPPLAPPKRRGEQLSRPEPATERRGIADVTPRAAAIAAAAGAALWLRSRIRR